MFQTTHRLILDELAQTKSQDALDPEMADRQNLARWVEARSLAEAAKRAVSNLTFPLRTVFILSV